MSDRTTKLREAILRDVLLVDANGDIAIRLKSGVYRILLRSNTRLQDELADAIVAAVLGVLDENETVEWGVQYGDDDVVVAIWDDGGEKPEQIARRRHNGTTRVAVRRRVTEWEKVSADV